MDLVEFERQPVTKDAEFETVADDDQMQIDLQDAVILLTKCNNLMNYLADVDLCKTLSKKERDTMAKMSVKVKEYLDEMESSYGEQG